jgi:hypothetical protein
MLIQYTGGHAEVEHPFDPTETVKLNGRIKVTHEQARAVAAGKPGAGADWTLVGVDKPSKKDEAPSAPDTPAADVADNPAPAEEE